MNHQFVSGCRAGNNVDSDEVLKDDRIKWEFLDTVEHDLAPDSEFWREIDPTAFHYSLQPDSTMSKVVDRGRHFGHPLLDAGRGVPTYGQGFTVSLARASELVTICIGPIASSSFAAAFACSMPHLLKPGLIWPSNPAAASP